MTFRLLFTSTLALTLAGPAFADCMQEIQSLSKAVIQAETGASSAATGLPATQHQESLLAGDQQAKTAETAGANTAKEEMPASPHQQQALTEQTEQGGEQQPADLIAEARVMAEAGDEE